ncbi:MAG: L-aspartate oxidase [Myxococcota bacterium]
MQTSYDALVLGGGIAGLTYALRVAAKGTVGLLTKRGLSDSNTAWAQGGIAVVMDQHDSFEAHVTDTITAGDGLNDAEVVRLCVEEGPERLAELIARGVAFTRAADGQGGGLDLTREGGHSARRVVHAKDMTGAAVQAALVAAVQAHPNIEIFERHQAIDLLTRRRLGLSGPDRCLGAYVYDLDTGEIATFRGKATLLATGGAGKVYLYTSNPDVATGDGIAMAWRAGAAIANMEFFQFHPTCLYNPTAKNFLVTEACRGEGGILRRKDGYAFMADYHPMKDLAPRDIVARAIDQELKRGGDDFVQLDMTHLAPGEVADRFPGVSTTLQRYGIDMAHEPIPVVPAAHYCCGGVQSDIHGRSTLPGLLVAGEVAHTGLHGANRLASNSLLEGMVFGHRAAEVTDSLWATAGESLTPDVPDWNPGSASNPDENVLVTQAWDETRRVMWNYVGIVRSNRRLVRARRRLDLLRQEITHDYWKYVLTPDSIELRNILTVAGLIVECALMRKESRGLHYTLDYPDRDDAHGLRATLLQKGAWS